MCCMVEIVLLVLLILMSLWAVMATRILYAAIGLAFTSIVLAIILFRMASPLAAVIELSVCAGLITAIFISVISLVKHYTKSEIEARSKVRWRKYIMLPILTIILGILLVVAVKPHLIPMPQALAETDVQKVFWHLRQADMFGQILLLLAGAFGIVVLFKDRIKK